MLSLITCSHCKTPLQLPPNTGSVRCAICRSVTHVEAFTGPLRNYFPAPPSGAPPPAHGKKRAVICAVSYRKSRHELKGASMIPSTCVTSSSTASVSPRIVSLCSPVTWQSCVAPSWGLGSIPSAPKEPSNFYLFIIIPKSVRGDHLIEEETDRFRIPTKRNIRMALYWLVQGCQPGDSLVFYYSGHGSQQRNYNGDEVDGYDETICPLVFETQGMIVDDEINATIVRPLPFGVKLHALIDACHSGTVLDLPFLCRMNRNGYYNWEDHRPRSGAWKGTNGGEAISFSGCDDNQTSANTSALARITSTGAMTYCFIKAFEEGHATYGSILSSMRSTIRNTTGATGPVSSMVTDLVSGGSFGGLKQEPQLTSNVRFDVYQKPFSL